MDRLNGPSDLTGLKKNVTHREYELIQSSSFFTLDPMD